MQKFYLGKEKPQGLFILKNCINDWLALEDSNELLVLSDSSYEESRNDDTILNHTTLGDVWEVEN